MEDELSFESMFFVSGPFLEIPKSGPQVSGLSDL